MSQIPKIFVINLEKSSERREFMTNQFKKLDLPFEFVKATHGKELTYEEKKMFSAFKSFKNMGRELHSNEKGCYLSHFYIWKRMIEQNLDEVLVFEDDIIISQNFKELIEKRKSWLPNEWGIINFGWDIFGKNNYKIIKNIHSSQSYSLIKFNYNQDVMRTGSYLLSLNSAKVLIEKSYPIKYVIDTLTGSQSIHNLKIYGILPRLANWSDDIESDHDNRELWAKKNRTSIKGIIYRIILKLTS